MNETTTDIFISCSGVDEDQKLLDELVTQLRASDRDLRIWHERMAEAGANIITITHQHLVSARGILLLISADYLASEDLMAEAEAAFERQHDGTAVIFPILLRATNWRAHWPNMSILPLDQKPVNAAADRDNAWNQIAQRVLQDLNQLRMRQPLHAQRQDLPVSIGRPDETFLLERLRRQTPATQEEREGLDVLLQATWTLQGLSDPVARSVAARYFLSLFNANIYRPPRFPVSSRRSACWTSRLTFIVRPRTTQRCVKEKQL